MSTPSKAPTNNATATTGANSTKKPPSISTSGRAPTLSRPVISRIASLFKSDPSVKGPRNPPSPLTAKSAPTLHTTTVKAIAQSQNAGKTTAPDTKGVSSETPIITGHETTSTTARKSAIDQASNQAPKQQLPIAIPPITRRVSSSPVQTRQNTREVNHDPDKLSSLPANSPPPSPGRRPERSLSPHRSNTSPVPSHVSLPPTRVHKRIIVCCDGTWQDGIVKTSRWMYSNVLKIARSLHHEDARHSPPIPQVVFYQSGLGSDPNFYSHWVEGAFGTHLAEKVQEAYAFIAQNYYPGDEIFLFGFSRGAYTARMVAALVGEIGVLDRTAMDAFADIFIAYQKRGKTHDPKERAHYDEILAPYESPGCVSKQKVAEEKFTVKCVGVFDTVGSLGLPASITSKNHNMEKLFDFPDKLLGPHIERAYHAMALNETREDFNVAKYHQNEEGRSKGQILRQCWFAGSHTDVGGGWQDHDLSDLTLIWMMANVEDILSIDLRYLKSLPQPVAGWGKQIHHDAKEGIFRLGGTLEREIKIDPETHETIHASVEEQPIRMPAVHDFIREHREHVLPLLPLEEEIRLQWHYVEGQTPVREDEVQAKAEARSQNRALETLTHAVKKAANATANAGREAIADASAALSENPSMVQDEGGKLARPHPQDSRIEDSSMSKVWHELMKK